MQVQTPQSPVSAERQQRPHHQRSKSSNIFRALVSPKSRPASPEPNDRTEYVDVSKRTQQVPLLPPDHPHTTKTQPLGERNGNVQSPPASPRRRERKAQDPEERKARSRSKPRKENDTKPSGSPKKSKSSTSLSAMFSKMNRSSKDLSQVTSKDKENATPPSSATESSETPTWAQDSSEERGRPSTRDGTSSHDLLNEIERYTPSEYSPSKQQDYNGSLEQPALRPTLCSRPQSAYVQGSDGVLDAIGRRVSGPRKSEDSGRRRGGESERRVSVERPAFFKRASTDRKVSGSSAEQAAPAKEKITVAKRGARVMAAVAAFQGKAKEAQGAKEEPRLDSKAVDSQFEAVLDSRNIPEPMRQKMRNLTLRVKADFIKQDKGTKSAGGDNDGAVEADETPAVTGTGQEIDDKEDEEDPKATKRSRARSRTFTFSKGDKRGDGSPSKKQRSQSKSRPTSIHIPKETPIIAEPGPGTPKSLLSRRSAGPTSPADFIKYLRKEQDPTKVEVGRMHKLRILLRNETVAWVDSFISQDGMTEIVGLLHRIMAIEWREEHEDQLLHETLLCMKGLCTTERALTELEKVADRLFPALIAMLFDEEKKGPAEYTTRTVIINMLFTFLSSCTTSPPDVLEARARRILTYLGEPSKPETDRPVNFVLDMHQPRPYKLWNREVSNVTKEVFWIFLHHANVIPLPDPTTATNMTPTTTNPTENSQPSLSNPSYTATHFPRPRPPVPAAPYIGGVEWDATTYLTSHLDLLNGLLASLPALETRNSLRSELRASGFEKCMGGTLRTCKAKFYSGVHDGLGVWVCASQEDGWGTAGVRTGVFGEEQQQQRGSPRKGFGGGAKGKGEAAPKLELPGLVGLGEGGRAGVGGEKVEDEGWLG